MTQQNNMQKTQAVDPQQVLVDYLDQLLNESPAEVTEVARLTTDTAEVLAVPVVSEAPVEAPSNVINEAPVEAPSDVINEAPVEAPSNVINEAPVEAPSDVINEAPVEAPSDVINEAPVEVPTEEDSQPATTDVAEQLPADVLEQIREVPVWAQQPSFQVLLFKVSGITLAVPLDSLNGILEWHEDNITEMPGAAEYFLGLLPERDRQIKLVDTARIVVPSKFRQNHRRENLQKIILIGDGEWGLACDAVDEVITLAPTDVRWRSSQGLRPWLAGTVIEQMSALLNVNEFVNLLSSEQLQVAD